jgi:hypothetical protein
MGEAVLSYGKGGRVWAFDSRLPAGDPVAWTIAGGKGGGLELGREEGGITESTRVKAMRLSELLTAAVGSAA